MSVYRHSQNEPTTGGKEKPNRSLGGGGS